MFTDNGTDKPVLIDFSEMLDAEGSMIDVIVRYSIIPAETEAEAETEAASSNGF